MPKFTCIEPIEHDLRRHDPGAEIILTDEAAAPLLLIGHIVRGASSVAAEAVGSAQEESTGQSGLLQRAARAVRKAVGTGS